MSEQKTGTTGAPAAAGGSKPTVGTEVGDPRAATGSATETQVTAYPDPRGLESVFLYHRDHARKKLFEFLAGFERDDFTRPLDCLGEGSIRDRAVHMMDTERFWTSVLQNRVSTPLRTEDFPDANSLVASSHEATDRTLNILHTADAGWFNRPDLFSLPGRGAPLTLVPSMVILHVLTHEFHHKGQICAAARAMGYEVPDLDLI
jgi:uncharacterized damage-inducible protein DinB